MVCMRNTWRSSLCENKIEKEMRLSELIFTQEQRKRNLQISILQNILHIQLVNIQHSQIMDFQTSQDIHIMRFILLKLLVVGRRYIRHIRQHMNRLKDYLIYSIRMKKVLLYMMNMAKPTLLKNFIIVLFCLIGKNGEVRYENGVMTKI